MEQNAELQKQLATVTAERDELVVALRIVKAKALE